MLRFYQRVALLVRPMTGLLWLLFILVFLGASYLIVVKPHAMPSDLQYTLLILPLWQLMLISLSYLFIHIPGKQSKVRLGVFKRSKLLLVRGSYFCLALFFSATSSVLIWFTLKSLLAWLSY